MLSGVFFFGMANVFLCLSLHIGYYEVTRSSWYSSVEQGENKKGGQTGSTLCYTFFHDTRVKGYLQSHQGVCHRFLLLLFDYIGRS